MSEGSYRESHLQKGVEYHQSFLTRPHLSMVWRLERRLLRRIVQDHFPDGIPSYLDFACGTGRILEFLSPVAASSTGVDLSTSMLQVARDTLADVEFINADITRDDRLGNRKFDLVTAFRFFPNAEPQLRRDALSVITRHLKAEGILVFNNHRNRGSLTRRIVDARGRFGRNRSSGAMWGMSRLETYELVAAAGLKVEREYPLAIFPLGERHMLRPIGALEAAESILSRMRLLTPMAQNLIYVCRHADAGP